jgi:hypothetical protein
LNEHTGNGCAREATKSATVERRSAAEQKSGIGGEMVRTITNVADPDELKAQETTGEGVSPIGAFAEQDLKQDIDRVVSTLLEIGLLGDVNCARLWENMSEEAGQARASELPGMSLAEGWLAEPEWSGESSESGAETAAGSREPE